MGLGLPALLQGFDSINPQRRRCAQHLGLFDHGLTQLHALRLQSLQGLGRMGNGFFPKWLQFGKGFFSQVTGIAPTIAELVQDAAKAFPVLV